MPYWRLSAWYFCCFAFFGAFSPYLGLYLQSLNFSAWDISVLLSLLQAMRLFAPNLWGWLAERMGVKLPIVRASTALALTSFAGFFFTTSFAGLFMVLATLAFFSSASLPLVEALTLAHLRQRPERYGRIRLWGSVGFIAAVLGVGALLDAQPLPALLWVSALLLGGTLLCSLLLTEVPAEAAQAGHAALGDTLRRPAVMALLLAGFLMMAAHGPLNVFYSIHLVDHGYGKTLVGALWSLGVVAEILVFLVMPRMLARFSLRGILLTSFACAVLRFLMIGWGVDFPAVLLLAQLLHGATFGTYHAATMAALHRWFPGHQQARAQALYGSVSFGAGGMLGGLLSGQIWDAWGAGWTFSFGSLFALIGLWLVWAGLGRSPASPESAPGASLPG